MPIPSDWAGSQFILKIDDVPTSGLSDLRVRFDLIGSGAVWIDDVQLFHLEFSTEERQKLLALLAFTAFQLQNNKWGECQRRARWLLAAVLIFSNVPLSARRDGKGNRTDSGEEKQAARPWTMERMRNWWKR